MKPKQFWYNNGSYDLLSESAGTLSALLISEKTGIHKCWRTSGTRIPFFREQFDLLLDELEYNNLDWSMIPDPESIFLIIQKLLHKNRVFKGAVIHMFFVKSPGSINPSDTGLFILSEIHRDERFILNNSGLCLGVLKNIVHPGYDVITNLTRVDPAGSCWDKYLDEGVDAGIMTNSDNIIVEGNNASVFIIGANELYTPSLSLGGINRAIRNIIMAKARELGLKVIETEKLEAGHLNDADEVFIANDLEGIKWVVGFGHKRFFRNYSMLILNLINRDWERP